MKIGFKKVQDQIKHMRNLLSYIPNGFIVGVLIGILSISNKYDENTNDKNDIPKGYLTSAGKYNIVAET